jgi:hypothetical protein
MASMSGRISSAKLLRSARMHNIHSTKIKDETSSQNEIEIIDDNCSTDESKSVKSLKIKDQNPKETEKEEIFKLLTPEKIYEKKLKIKQRESRIKNQERKNSATEGKLVDGEIIYDDKIDLIDDIDDNGDKDPTIADGNQLPERLGKIPEGLLQKPLEEIGIKNFKTRLQFKNCYFFLLDPYISLREEVRKHL